MEKITTLKERLGEDRVKNSKDFLEKYTVGKICPNVVLLPSDESQGKLIIKLAQKYHKKIIFLGNNSQQNFGGKLESIDWAVSLSGLNKIVSHDVADLTATVQPGIELKTLQKQLRQHQQFLPLNPPFSASRTIGGIVMNNDSGSLRYQHGSCRDLILGMRMALANGTVIKTGGKTVKNVAGYNLSRLFIGSMGTLGMATEITFKLAPLPKFSQSIILGFEKTHGFSSFLNKVLSSHFTFSQCEYFNSEFKNEFLDGKLLSDSQHYIALNISGNKKMVEHSINELNKLSKNFSAKESTVLFGKGEQSFLESIENRFSTHHQNKNSIIGKFIVPKSELAPIIDFTENHSKIDSCQLSLIGHAGNGTLYFKIDTKNANLSSSETISLINDFREEAKNRGGTLHVTYAPNNIREANLIWGKAEDTIYLMRSIKNKYDPENIIAAGRYYGGL